MSHLFDPRLGLLFSLITTMIHIFCVAELLGHTALKAMGNRVEEVKLLDCLLKDPLLGLQCWATRNMERESFLVWIA